MQVSRNSPHPKINEQLNKNYKYRNTKTKIEDSNIVIHTMTQYPRYRYTKDEEAIQLYTVYHSPFSSKNAAFRHVHWIGKLGNTYQKSTKWQVWFENYLIILSSKLDQKCLQHP